MIVIISRLHTLFIRRERVEECVCECKRVEKWMLDEIVLIWKGGLANMHYFGFFSMKITNDSVTNGALWVKWFVKWNGAKLLRFNRLANGKLYQKLYSHQFNDFHISKMKTLCDMVVIVAMYAVLVMIFQTRFYYNSNGIDRWQTRDASMNDSVLCVRFKAFAGSIYSKCIEMAQHPIYSVTDKIWINYVWSSTPNQSFYFCA